MPHTPPLTIPTPWLTPREAAARAQVSTKLVYNAVRNGKLKAARLGVRNDIRIHETWVDAWITAAVILNPEAPGDAGAALAFPASATARASRRRATEGR